MLRNSRTGALEHWIGRATLGVLVMLGTACGADDDGGSDAATDTGADLIDVEETSADAVGDVPPRDAAADADDDAPGCPFGELSPGVCRPTPPTGTPTDACPSESFGAAGVFSDQGICLPHAPQSTPTDACEGGVFAAVDGMDGEGICVPSPPLLQDWTCPDGWAARSELLDREGDPAAAADLPSLVACAAPTFDSDCGAAERPLPGGGCALVGTACPAGILSEDAARARAEGFDGAVWFVRSDGGSDAAGTAANPFPTMTDALAATTDGDVIVVDGAVPLEDVRVETRVALVGTCASDATLTLDDATLTLAEDGIALADLHLALSGAAGVVVDADASLSGVALVGGDTALSANGSVQLDDTVIRGATTGVLVAADADLRASDSAIDGFSATGVGAEAGAQVTVERALIRQGSDVAVESTTLFDVDGASLALSVTVLEGGRRGIAATDGAEVTLTDVTIRGAAAEESQAFAVGVDVRGRSSVVATRTAWESMYGRALWVRDADAALVDCVTREARVTSDAVRVTPIPALDVEGAGTLELDRVVVSRASGAGVQARDGATLEARDLVVFRTQFVGVRHSTQTVSGIGVAIRGTSEGTLERVWVQEGGDAMVLFEESTGTIHDLISDGGGWTTNEAELPAIGGAIDAAGVACRTRCELTARRVRVLDHLGDGLESSNDSDLDATDLWMDGLGRDGVYSGNYGISVDEGQEVFTIGDPSRATVQRGMIANFNYGARVYPEEAVLNGTDLVVDGGAPDAEDSRLAAGISVQAAEVRLERSVLRRAQVGVSGTHRARFFAEDLVIEDGGVHTGSRGIDLSDALGSLTRVRVSGNSEHGIVVSTRSSISGEDLIVQENEGRGVTVQRNSIANAARVWVTANDGVGIYVADNGRATFTDLVAARTQQRACFSSTCPDTGEGFGIGVFDASTLTLERMIVDANAVIGIAVDAAGSLEATDGIVSNQLIGVNVTAPSFDPTTAFVNVRTIGNQVDLSSREIPVPELLDESEPPDDD